MRLSDFRMIGGKVFTINEQVSILSESVYTGFNEVEYVLEISRLATLTKELTSINEDDVFAVSEKYIQIIDSAISLIKKFGSDLNVYPKVSLETELSDIRKTLLLNAGELKRNNLGAIKYDIKRYRVIAYEGRLFDSQLNSITLKDVRSINNIGFNVSDLRMDRYDSSYLMNEYGVDNLLQLVYLMANENFILRSSTVGSTDERVDRFFDSSSVLSECAPCRDSISLLESLAFLYNMKSIIRQQINKMEEDSSALQETIKVLDNSEKLIAGYFIKAIFGMGILLTNTMYNISLAQGCAKYKAEIADFLK